MNSTNKNIINILNIIPDDILEKLFCIKPCINKKLQKYFNNNIEKLYNEFIKTTKNDRMIKLHIINNAGSTVNCNNFIEKINDENKYKTIMSDIEDDEDEDKCYSYNYLLNKYKLYNNVFGVNYFKYEDNEIDLYYTSTSNNNGIFIWRCYMNDYIDNIIKKFISILTKNFYKLFIDGGIVGYDEIRDYIKSVAKWWVRKNPLKKFLKIFKTNKKPTYSTIDFSGNYYYNIENLLCYMVDSYIGVRPIWDDYEDCFFKHYETYESFKIQNRLYLNIINKDGIYRG
jgi:hypothetical protein